MASPAPKEKRKRVRVRFYTSLGFYKGNLALTHVNYHNNVKNWLRSGNYVKIKIGKGKKGDLLITYHTRGVFFLNSFLNEHLKEHSDILE